METQSSSNIYSCFPNGVNVSVFADITNAYTHSGHANYRPFPCTSHAHHRPSLVAISTKHTIHEGMAILRKLECRLMQSIYCHLAGTTNTKKKAGAVRDGEQEENCRWRKIAETRNNFVIFGLTKILRNYSSFSDFSGKVLGIHKGLKFRKHYFIYFSHL